MSNPTKQLNDASCMDLEKQQNEQKFQQKNLQQKDLQQKDEQHKVKATSSTTSSISSSTSSSPSSTSTDIGREKHYSQRSPWLRALVLGANDGLVSIASLLLGMSAVSNNTKEGGTEGKSVVALSGLAGLIAGACSMAVGEFVSVSSQRDSEVADMKREEKEHAERPEEELEELAAIYVRRGLSYGLAKKVAEEMSGGGREEAVRAHVRDELGIDVEELSNPIQAALVSAMAFGLGGGVPLLAGAFVGEYGMRMVAVVVACSVGLTLSGGVGGRLGGANVFKAGIRVAVGGWFAMLVTFGILYLVALKSHSVAF